MASRRAWLVLSGILLALAILLSTHPERNFFIYDGSGLPQVKALLNDGVFPTSGMKVYGQEVHPPGPLYVLLLAVPYAIWPHVLSGYIFFGLLGLLTVVGLFLVGRSCFNAPTGLWLAALYATDWPAMMARDLESSSCLPLFVLLLMAATLELARSRRGWVASLMLPLFVAALQIHLSIVFLLPPLVWTVVDARRAIRRRDLLLGIGLSLILLGPYLVDGLRKDLPFFLHLADNARLHREAPYLRVLLTTLVLEPRSWTAVRVLSVSPVGAYGLNVVVWARYAFWLLGIGYVALRFWRGRISGQKRPLEAVVLLWSLGPLILLSVSERLPVIHYLIPPRMGQLMASAILAARLTSSSGGPVARGGLWIAKRLTAAVLLAFLLVGGAWWNLRWFLPGQAELVPEFYSFSARATRGLPPEFLSGRFPRLEDHPLFHEPSILAR